MNENIFPGINLLKPCDEYGFEIESKCHEPIIKSKEPLNNCFEKLEIEKEDDYLYNKTDINI